MVKFFKTVTHPPHIDENRAMELKHGIVTPVIASNFTAFDESLTENNFCFSYIFLLFIVDMCLYK